MPIYEYHCEEHGDFSRQTTIADRNEDCFCPICGRIATRIISAPSLALMSPTNRNAWARNEKSAHEPTRKHKHVCTSACNHGHNHTHDKTNKKSEYMQSPTNGRPWMLGH